MAPWQVMSRICVLWVLRQTSSWSWDYSSLDLKRPRAQVFTDSSTSQNKQHFLFYFQSHYWYKRASQAVSLTFTLYKTLLLRPTLAKKQSDIFSGLSGKGSLPVIIKKKNDSQDCGFCWNLSTICLVVTLDKQISSPAEQRGLRCW